MRVKGGGHTSQVYAIRQAIAKAVVAYYAKYFDAFSALELKKTLVAYDRTLLIADPRRMEPKKFGGHGARARRQKSCVLRTVRRPRSVLMFSSTVTVKIAYLLASFYTLAASCCSRTALYAMETCQSHEMLLPCFVVITSTWFSLESSERTVS